MMQVHEYSTDDKAVARRENIFNNQIVDWIRIFKVLHHDERSENVTVDQDEIIKRNFS